MRRTHMAFAALVTAAIMLGTSASVMTSAPDAASPAPIVEPAAAFEPTSAETCEPGRALQAPGTDSACCIP